MKEVKQGSGQEQRGFQGFRAPRGKRHERESHSTSFVGWSSDRAPEEGKSLIAGVCPKAYGQGATFRRGLWRERGPETKLGCPGGVTLQHGGEPPGQGTRRAAGAWDLITTGPLVSGPQSWAGVLWNMQSRQAPSD